MSGTGPVHQSAASPADIDAAVREAMAHLQSGRTADALALFQRAVAHNPASAPAQNGCGVALCVADRPFDSLEYFERAIALQPGFALAHANRGNALRTLGRHAEAIDCFRRAVDVQPNFPAALNFQGLSYMQLGLHQQALTCFERAVGLDSRYANAHFNRGACCIDLGLFQQALQSLENAVALDPADATAFHDRGVALMGCSRPADALASFDRALQLRPQYPIAHAGRATALSSLGRVDEAILAYEHAVTLEPSRAETHSDLAAALLKQNRLEDAVARCNRALALKPDLHDAWTNRGQALLLQGSMVQGWSDYEHRFFKSNAPPPRHARVPRWSGEKPLQGQRILLWSEQGLGDTLQFVRYVPIVQACGGEVALEVQAAARPVLAELDGVLAVHAEGEAGGPYDLQCPLMSVPHAISAWHPQIPAQVPYLRANPARVAAWKLRLGSGPKIGLVCSGNAAHGNDANRSIPLLLFEPIMGLAQVLLLQREVRSADEPLLAKFALEDLRADLHDLGETAAVVESLDLVISVDTSVAHLAGALNKPVWILLPWAPDWRWKLGRTDTPWYPSARLFRQPRAGDWASVIEVLRQELGQGMSALPARS